MSSSNHPAARLVTDHATSLGRRIAAEVARELDVMREPLMSGDDSGLTTVWQEICAQVQGEDSFFWDQYRNLMGDVVQGRLQCVSAVEREMLWLQGETGWDWLWEVDHAIDEPAPPHPGVDDDSIAEWIVSVFLQSLAEFDDNQNVARFLARDESGYDEEEDEDEENEDRLDEHDADDEQEK